MRREERGGEERKKRGTCNELPAKCGKEFKGGKELGKS